MRGRRCPARRARSAGRALRSSISSRRRPGGRRRSPRPACPGAGAPLSCAEARPAAARVPRRSRRNRHCIRHVLRTTRDRQEPRFVGVLATVRTFALLGVEATTSVVEVDVRGGLPSFAIVGLPDAAVRESRERVRAAICNSGFEFPQSGSPSTSRPPTCRRPGPDYDLAIAAGLLVASGQLDRQRARGRRAWPGRSRSTARCGRSSACCRWRCGPGRRACVSSESLAPRGGGRPGRRRPAPTASGDAGDRDGHRARRLSATSRELGTAGRPGRRAPAAGLRRPRGGRPRRAARPGRAAPGAGGRSGRRPQPADAGPAGRRQVDGRPPHALDPASARDGRGDRGAGGRQRMRCQLPPLSRARITPVSRPSSHDLVRGAGRRRHPAPPGRADAARTAVLLFLDELPEFSRDALEALRQPLEEGRIVDRPRPAHVALPCRTMLVAAANPCPCGRAAGE